MIHIHSPIDEPPAFDEDCRQRGLAWLAEHPNHEGRPNDYWSPFRDGLAMGFGWRCGYKAMFTHEGTVDHFISWDTDRNQAYEWDNYRFICGGINSSKKTADANVLDPFEVQDDWFRLVLPTLELILTDAIPQDVRPRAEHTVRKFGLDRGENVIRRRRDWYSRHLNGLPLAQLDDFAPLIARAVREWINAHGNPLPPLPPPV